MEKAMAPHSSTLAWESQGKPCSVGGHLAVTLKKLFLIQKIYWFFLNKKNQYWSILQKWMKIENIMLNKRHKLSYIVWLHLCKIPDEANL